MRESVPQAANLSACNSSISAELANRLDFNVVGEYCDEGISGSRESRPALDALLKDARRRKFDAVLVWKLDRLGRSLVHLVRLLQDLRVLGVELISFSEGLDFTTTTGKLVRVETVAQTMPDQIFERELLLERNIRVPSGFSFGGVDSIFTSAHDVVFGVEHFENQLSAARWSCKRGKVHVEDST